MVVTKTKSGSESAATSIRQVPAGTKKLVKEGFAKVVNLDFGGGRYDDATEYLNKYGVENLIYDPYNRSEQHNVEVLEFLMERDGADTATMNNVLNVIPTLAERLAVVKRMMFMLKPDGIALVTVYEGDKSGELKETVKGWQNNKTLTSYFMELMEHLPQFVIRRQKRDYMTIRKRVSA